MVLAQHVITEVERALLEVLRAEPAEEADALLADYFTFIDKARPVIVPLAATQEIAAAARVIHHLNDALVLAAAITARPGLVALKQHRAFHYDRGAPHRIANRHAL